MSTHRDKSRFWRFVLAGLSANRWGNYEDAAVNTKKADETAISQLSSKDDLSVIIEEGRRQIDSQHHRIEYASTRAQVLFVFGIGVIGFLLAQFRDVDRLDEPIETLSRILLAVGGILVAYGTAGASAVLVTRVVLTRPDTTDLANGGPGAHARLAADYADSVILGENSAAARARHLRSAVAFVMLGITVGFSGVLLVLW